MDNTLEKLKWRLQSVANNRRHGGCDGPALILINLFLSGSTPIAWYKPQRVPLEPKLIDFDLLPMSQKCDNWKDAMTTLIPGDYDSVTLDRVLVIDSEGDPVGYL